MTSPSTPTAKICTFELDGGRYAVDVARVQEVLRNRTPAPIPRAHSDVAGLVNLRGRIVPVIELRTRMGLRPRPSGDPCAFVVVRSGDEFVGLAVDAAGDLADAPAELRTEPPEALPAKVRHLVLAVHRAPDGLIVELDVDRAAALDAPSE